MNTKENPKSPKVLDKVRFINLPEDNLLLNKTGVVLGKYLCGEYSIVLVDFFPNSGHDPAVVFTDVCLEII